MQGTPTAVVPSTEAGQEHRQQGAVNKVQKGTKSPPQLPTDGVYGGGTGNCPGGEKKQWKGAFRAVVPSVEDGQEQHGEGSCTKVDLVSMSTLKINKSSKKRSQGKGCGRNAARKRERIT